MKHIVSLSVFLIIAIIAWWSITEDYADKTGLIDRKSGNYAEIFMNEFEMIAMNKNGQPGYTLRGKHLSRNVGSDDTSIEQPVFHLLKADEEWQITAETAIINDEKETILLNKNVEMRQKNSSPAIIIRTQDMMIQTETQVASTRSGVELTRGESRLLSKGMIFDNRSSELELLSDVKGYYLPDE